MNRENNKDEIASTSKQRNFAFLAVGMMIAIAFGVLISFL